MTTGERNGRKTPTLEQLRKDWNCGQRPQPRHLRGYLREVPEPQRWGTLMDLIAQHLWLTWQTNAGLRLEDYIGEFSGEFESLSSPAAVPAELVEKEFVARFQLPHGDKPQVMEYRQRFEGRKDIIDLLCQRCVDGDRYVKLRKRGEGAMGVVWEAYDRATHRLLAIKEPRPALADKEEALRHFAEEARVTVGLKHSGIVHIREREPAEGSTPIYTMRLVNGTTLSERIRDYHHPAVARSSIEQRHLWDQLLWFFVQVCDALNHAHGHGVLHRDLKPGNIFIDESGDAVIFDWGMAASAAGKPEDATSARVVVGTPDYMAPEQADGIADVRSDVFGLGAILYEILTGRSPHVWPGGSRPAEWLQVVSEARFKPPRHLNPQVPPALEAICLKALAHQPGDRYQSATELADDLSSFLATERAAASAQPIWRKLWLWIRERR